MVTPIIPPAVERRYEPKLSLKRLSYTDLSQKFKDLIKASEKLDAAVPSGAQPWHPNPDTDMLRLAAKNYDDALKKWNPLGPRGSEKDHTILRERRLEAEQVFMNYSKYVASWSRYNGEFIHAAGLEIKGQRSPAGPTGFATNLQQIFFTGRPPVQIMGGHVGLRFKKAASARSYCIYQFFEDGSSKLLDAGTKVRYTRLGGSYKRGEQVIVKVQAIGPKGPGAMSAPITLTAI